MKRRDGMNYRINCDAVLSQANSIENRMVDLFNQIQRVKKLQENCKIVWKSKAADQFSLKLNTLYTKMDRTKKEMSDLVETIKYCVNSVQQEDQRIAREASMLSSEL